MINPGRAFLGRLIEAYESGVRLHSIRELHTWVCNNRHDWPELSHLHFMTAGAFPYSHDLADIMWTLTESGLVMTDEEGALKPKFRGN